jgi:hypothetical protein
MRNVLLSQLNATMHITKKYKKNTQITQYYLVKNCRIFIKASQHLLINSIIKCLPKKLTGTNNTHPYKISNNVTTS